jgi:hypothetical protein
MTNTCQMAVRWTWNWNGIVQGVLYGIPWMIEYLIKQNIRVWLNA